MKAFTKLALLAIGSITFNPLAAAAQSSNWVSLGRDSGGNAYLDRSSVVRQGNQVQYSVVVYFDRLNEYGAQESVSSSAADCSDLTHVSPIYTAFLDQAGQTIVSQDLTDLGTVRIGSAQAIEYKALRAACR